MPNEAECSRVICPFFKRLSPNRRGVVCECTVERAELMMHFPASAERASWMDAACEQYGYAEACPVAKMLLMKWEDEVG